MILDILNTIANNPSKNFKQQVLELNKHNLVLESVLEMALNPFINFYQRKIPAYNPNPHSDVTLPEALARLEVLSTREKTGNAAISFLQDLLASLSPDDAEVIERVILKDLKAGFAESTVNKVWPNLIPTYPIMLASAFDQKLVDKIGFPAHVEEKLDGMRVNLVFDAGKVSVFSRNGKPLFLGTHFDAIAEQMAQGDFVMIDGELMVKDKFGKYLDRKTGNGILNKAVKGTITQDEIDNVHLVAYDIVTVKDHWENGHHPVRREDRLNNLVVSLGLVQGNHAHKISMVPMWVVTYEAQIQSTFQAMLDQGKEGIILKDINAPWEDKRSKGLVKFKAEEECDLEVIGWAEGTGKLVGKMGAVTLASRDRKIVTDCGSGFNDKHREWKAEDVIGKIMTVKYNARIQDKNGGVEKLFLPIFLELRLDKAEADSSETIK